MSDSFLRNAPLKEVLLELHWNLDYITEEKIQIDKGFEQALLNFINKCNGSFGKIKLLKPENIPPVAFSHRVTHRFYRKDGEYPLLQIGPGVFTVNDNNKNYVWHDFRELIEYGIDRLKASYEKHLVLSKVELRYIDRCSPYVLGQTDKFDFLRNHLKVNAESYDFVEGDLREIQFGKLFHIDENIALNIFVTTGVDHSSKEDIVEWHTFAVSRRHLNWKDLMGWVDQAHHICSNTFKKMISDELYEFFSN